MDFNNGHSYTIKLVFHFCPLGDFVILPLRCINYIAPTVITDRFLCVDDISAVNTFSSSRHDFSLPVTGLQQTKHSLVCHGVMTWNGLPVCVRSSITAKEFKKWVEMMF